MKQRWLDLGVSANCAAIIGDDPIATLGLKDKSIIQVDARGAVRWKVDIEDSAWGIATSPEALFTVVGTGPRKHRIFGLDHRGATVWSRKVGDWVPAVATSNDGSVVAVGTGKWDGRMYLLDSAGEVVRRDHSCRWVRALAVSPSGETVVCGSGHKNLYCFDRQGETRWGAATRGAVSSIAVADGNGPIFAATYPRDGLLYAFDRRGSLLWSHDLGGMGIVSTDLSGGFAIAGSSRGNIMAFSSTGTTLWTRQLGAPIVDISVSPDASLVAIAAGSGSGVVHFLSSDGANVGEIRSQDLPLKVGFSPSGQTATIVTKAQMHGVCHVLVAE